MELGFFNAGNSTQPPRIFAQAKRHGTAATRMSDTTMQEEIYDMRNTITQQKVTRMADLIQSYCNGDESNHGELVEGILDNEVYGALLQMFAGNDQVTQVLTALVIPSDVVFTFFNATTQFDKAKVERNAQRGEVDLPDRDEASKF